MKKTLLLLFLVCFAADFSRAQCGSGTPSFTANLTATPNGTWISPPVVRNDTCCGWTGTDVCIKFTIFLNPGSMGINFGIASGAAPGGALFYSINCGPPISIGTPICLSGTGPHILTFCKPGNNQNTYSISAIPAPVVPDSITVRDGCTQTLSVSGFSVPTITWSSVNPAPVGAYNSYLSCTAGCATVTVTPTGTPPPFVDYVVGGFGQSPCQAAYFQDTVRIYFYSNLIATINPTLSTICFGSTNTVLTVSASGGLPPYTYSWVPVGSTATQVTVGPGTYTVQLYDNTGCPPTTATAVVNQYTLPIAANAGTNFTICKSSPTVALSGTVTNATGGTWSGGSGTFSPVSASVTTNYLPTAGELSAGSVQLFLTTTGNSGCPPKQDTLVVSFQNIPIANAGPASTVCANNSLVSLSGSIGGFATTGTWSATGNGAFTSTTNLNTTFTPGSANLAAGSVTITLTSTGNGVCPPAVSNTTVLITPSPTVNAGTGGSTCGSNPFALSGTVTGGATTGAWTTNGNGSFSPASNVLNPSYTPGTADIAAGSVTLTLTSTNNGNCLPVTDTVIILIKQPAIPNAGPNQVLCSTTPTIGLGGTMGGGSTTGIWTSSGSGAFNPNNITLNAGYNITPADIAAGLVTFTLTSTNNGPCPAVTDTVKMVITKPATVSAGPNQFICATAGMINLAGTVVSSSNTGVWSSSGTGAFSPGATFLNTSYVLTTGDITSGTVIFTLTSTNNGVCAPVSDTVMMKIRQPSTANAGPNQSLCSTTPTIGLAGIIGGGGTTGIWTSNGTGGFNPNNTTLNTLYNITAADISVGAVIFTLTSTNNGPCPAVSDTALMIITKPATVSAGPNQFVCSPAGAINLAGSVISSSNTGVWSSSGTGAFSPGATFLNTSYALTAGDISLGTVIFTLTSTNNGVCAPVSDTVMMKIRQPSTANAGPNQSLCSTTPTIGLAGIIGGGGTTGIWTSNGTGGFNPNNTTLNSLYSITAGDITSGSVTFTLTSTNNGPCPAVSDTVLMIITKPATVSAGPNQFVCSSANNINLAGSVSSSSNTGFWSTNGTGAFNPGITSLNVSYGITPADITAGTIIFTLTSTNNGACAAVSDTVMMKIRQINTVNAGLNQSLCSNAGFINISGTVGGGGNTGVWSASGSGGYVPSSTALSTSYGITSSDISAGTVVFTLTSTNNGPCPAVIDTVQMVITQIATVNAGTNQYLCSNAGIINLTGGILSSSNTGVWSSNGSGSYSPSTTSLSTTYSLTLTDILNGSVTFTLASTNNGACPVVSDSVQIKIKQIATVVVGQSSNVCSNTSTVALTGTVSGGTSSSVWTTNGSGAMIPGVSSLNNTYFISVADIATGFINFTLTSTNNAPCPAVSDTMIVMITPVAQVNAGSNQFICSSTGTIGLNGIVNSNTNSGTWSSSGGGTYSPSNTILNPIYNLTPTDASNGSVTFTLSSGSNGPCPVVRDTVLIKIKKPAVANAGPDQVICSTTPNVILSGSVSAGSTSGTWSGTGGGSYSPNNSVLNASYNVSAVDINAGTVIFILTTTNNEVCPAVTDTTKLTIIKKPTIQLSGDTAVCAYQNPVKITANVSGGSGQYVWTSSGTGNVAYGGAFNILNYTMSAADIVSGLIKLTITSINNGPCGDMNASINLLIHPAPKANFSASADVANIPNDPIQFTNQSTGATSYYWNFGDGGFTNLTNPSHNYVTVGFYTVSLVATNQFKCTDTAYKDIKVISDIQFPNVFTPNVNGGNGGSYNPANLDNDVFFPYTSGVVEYKLLIFNRWGELVFESQDINMGWDGYFNGKLCQQDAYVWKADVKFFDGRKYNKTGNVTLLR
jgi:gliding motility-associated-like protein